MQWSRIASGVRASPGRSTMAAEAMRVSAEQAPDARFVQVEHAGHAPLLTHVDAVVDALQGVLAGVRA